jgi:hypothetical protein
VGTVVALLALLGRAGRPLPLPGLESLLASRSAPLVAGLAAASTVAWVWGSLREPGVVHDEIAYRLQAAIVASGRLAGPPPPLPEFFEQFHVLLAPALAPKYFPGHALVLASGVALGLPGLMPVLLAGLSAGLLFAVARRVANGWVAALATLLWLTAPAGLVWRATYFSQSTSTAAWLGMVWALREWVERGRSRHLVLVAALLAWCAITRPLTAVALSLPVAAVVLPRSLRRRAFRGLGLALVAGCLVIALIAPFNAAATGSPFTLPYSVYTRLYIPWDHMGFGFDPTPPLRDPTPEMVAYTDSFWPIYAGHTLAELPGQLLSRARSSARDMWGTAGMGWDWRAPLVLLALAAVPRGGMAVVFGLASVVSLLLMYLVYPHGDHWTLYYQETQPVLAYLTALGVARLFSRVGEPVGTRSAATPPMRNVAPLALASLLVLGLGLSSVAAVKDALQRWSAYQRHAAQLFARIPEPQAIVFIRYGPRHSPHATLVHNPPDYEQARLWLVHDRGEDNRRLLALAPQRVPYLFDEATFTLYRITGPPPPPR